MIAEVERRQTEMAELCRTYGVRRLELIGSATDPDAFDDAHSDLDFLVEFESNEMGPADQYFGLLGDLKRLFDREVDLITVRSLRNPYFIESINRTRRVLYASEIA